MVSKAVAGSPPPTAERSGFGIATLALWAGVAAPLLYVATVIVAGAVSPGYSHIDDAISELMQAGAPHKQTLDVAFAVYNGLLILFSAEIVRRSRPIRALVAGGGFTIAMAIAGLAMWPFAMDPIGEPMTFTGGSHIFFAGIASLCSLAALSCFAIGLCRVPGGRAWSRYALVSLLVTFVSGAIAGLSAVQLWPTMGLWERVTIGASLQFTFFFALALARRRLVLDAGGGPV